MPGNIRKNKINSYIVFIHYTQYQPRIIVASDASLYGIRACISPKMEDESLKPIAHASRTLLPAEKLLSDREGSTENYFCSYQIP